MLCTKECSAFCSLFVYEIRNNRYDAEGVVYFVKKVGVTVKLRTDERQIMLNEQAGGLICVNSLAILTPCFTLFRKKVDSFCSTIISYGIFVKNIQIIIM